MDRASESKRKTARAVGDQGSLFGPAIPARRREPLKQTTVIISADAITAITVRGIAAERIIAEAVRAARPDVRNVVVDLGTIRWTDPKSGRRVTFDAPAMVREALLGFARDGDVRKPFRFTLRRATQMTPGD
jgi:hypothetical protein